MKTEHKLLISVGVLPSMRDMLEDAIDDGMLRFEAKKKATNLINAIDSFTDLIFKGMELDASNEQVEIQNWFLSEVKELINR